jgi:hypothetical protein
VHKNKLSAKKVSIPLSDGMVYNHLVNYCRNCDTYYFRFPQGDKVISSDNIIRLSKQLLRSKEKKYSIKDIEKISKTE